MLAAIIVCAVCLALLTLGALVCLLVYINSVPNH
jgi:hypothetical protein